MEENLEDKLPEYLKHDIEMVEKYDFKTSSVYDCYLMELYASINVCMCDGIVSDEEAEELRKKYFYKNLDKGRD